MNRQLRVGLALFVIMLCVHHQNSILVEAEPEGEHNSGSDGDDGDDDDEESCEEEIERKLRCKP